MLIRYGGRVRTPSVPGRRGGIRTWLPALDINRVPCEDM